VGFAVLGLNPELFSAAVIGDCGQNIGPGRGFPAACGMRIMGLFASMMSNMTMMKGFAKIVASEKNLDEGMLLRTTFQAGFFFQKGPGIIKALSSIAPAVYIPRFPGPFFFANGSKDYHDSQDKWLSSCTNKDRSKLSVYNNGDHFFSHDVRFYEQFCQEIIDFYEKELEIQKTVHGNRSAVIAM
jgi:hypothetical protein